MANRVEVSVKQNRLLSVAGVRQLPRAAHHARPRGRRDGADSPGHDGAGAPAPPPPPRGEDARDARSPGAWTRHSGRGRRLDARGDRALRRGLRAAWRVERRGAPYHAGVLAGGAPELPGRVRQLRPGRLRAEASARNYSRLDRRSHAPRAPARGRARGRLGRRGHARREDERGARRAGGGGPRGPTRGEVPPPQPPPRPAPPPRPPGPRPPEPRAGPAPRAA